MFSFSSQNLKTVPPDGSLDAKVAIVGMAPSHNELRDGKPFVGPAGGRLVDCLAQTQRSRRELYITNVINFQPNTKNDLSDFWDEEKGIIYKSLYPHLIRLEKELKASKANVIVPMGNLPLLALCNRNRISKWRGSILESSLLPGRKIIPAIHPAATIHGNFMAMYTIAHDLDLAFKESEFPDIRLRERNYVITPGFQEALTYIESLQDCRRVSFDIEIFAGRVTCLAFAKSPTDAMCVPIAHYRPTEEGILWRAIAKILGDPNIEKIGQNLAFDTMYLLQNYKIHTRGHICDTMIAHKLLYQDYPKGLDFLVSMHCNGEPYYKDEGKIWKQKDVNDWPAFFLYNAKDAALTFEVWEAIEEDIMAPEYWPTYERVAAYLEPLNNMIFVGVNTDDEFLEKASTEINAYIEKTQKELNTMVGAPLNVKSVPQCKAYFYDKLKIQPFTVYDKKKKKSRTTINAKSLQKLAVGTQSRKPIREADLAMRIRSNRDLKSKYLDITFDEDGRFRCAYSPSGTDTGRLASSKTINGTGANHQNLPSLFRGFLIPDKGQVLIPVDERQAEWVVVAYQCGDENMIEVIESGKDAHVVSGMLISGLPEEFVLLENEYCGHARDLDQVERGRRQLENDHPEWHRDKLNSLFKNYFLPVGFSLRQMGKHSNHGFNYDMSPTRFAEEYGTNLHEATLIYQGYHKGYPGIKRGYEKIREQLKKDRTLINPFGRVRYFMDEWTPDMLRAAYDFIPQSTVADIANDAMKKIYDTASPETQILINCHDEIVSQHPDNNLPKLAKAIEHVITCFENHIEIEGRKFSIVADASVGYDWRNTIDLKNCQKAGEILQALPKALRLAKEKHDKMKATSILEAA